MLNQDEFGAIVLSPSTPKYQWKFKYRPIFKRSNISRWYQWTDISVGL